MEKLYRIEEVAALIGNSVFTINLWYRWKKKQPDNELAAKLPDITYKNGKKYWTQSDIYKLIEFKEMIPAGRNGVMGSVTNADWKKKHKKEREITEDE